MQPGFIKLYRKVFDHALWKESRSLSKFEAWLDLLQLAAFAPSKRFINGQFIEIAEGECIASLRYLGQRWQWSKNKVATFIAALESEKMLGRQIRHGETVILLTNYKEYAGSRPNEKDSDRDRGGTEKGQGRDKVQEDKERKEGEEGEEKEKSPSPPGRLDHEKTQSVPFNPHRMATFEQVMKFGTGQMPPVSVECCEAFFDRMEAEGWVTPRGFPLADWRARFRSWATNWANNAAGKKGASR